MEALNREGFSVCGIDQQGTGFSEGLECYVERFDLYVDDVLQFARWAALSCTGLTFLLLFLLLALRAHETSQEHAFETLLWHGTCAAVHTLMPACMALAAGRCQPAACQASGTCPSSWQAARWAAALLSTA